MNDSARIRAKHASPGAESFVFYAGPPVADWPAWELEIECSGVTARRRLRDWQVAGVWARLHRELLMTSVRRPTTSETDS
jgi:hypothetical protein